MMSNWLEASDWKRVQDSVPITCVDILPVRIDSGGAIAKVGLIFRDTPHQGRRWCVVGGRLWRNESLVEAATRQLYETLGRGIRFQFAPDSQPAYVSQYFTTQREVGSVDPRQHAVTLNYCVAIEGEPVPGGEAVGFRWFDPADLPPAEEFGFGQDRIVASIMASVAGRRLSQGV